MQEVLEEIKERVCEFVHERNKSGSAPCKNQRASCLQLIRVCDLTAIINQVAEKYNQSLINNGWILCSERLPTYNEKSEYYDPVNVTLDDGRVAEGCYRNKDKEWWVDAEDGEHYSINATGHVLAWKPLPEPYKPQKEGAHHEQSSISN